MKQIKWIPIEKLRLDSENPRLPERLRGANEKETFDWMLDEATLADLMASIAENGFFEGEPIIVMPDKGKTDAYIVVEGNRRLAAAKLLGNPKLASVAPLTVQALAEDAVQKKNVPTELPAIIVGSLTEIANYLGFRHLTGVKPWPLVAKARFLFGLFEEKKKTSDFNYSNIYKELAKEIGSKAAYVRRLLIGYEAYLTIIKRKKEFQKEGFDISYLGEDEINLSIITDALTKYQHIADYVGMKIEENEPMRNVNMERFGLLVNWLYGKRVKGATLLGESRNLSKLNKILQFEAATERLLAGAELNEALRYTDDAENNLRQSFDISLQHLQHLRNLVTRDARLHSQDVRLSEELADLCEDVRLKIKRIYREQNEE